MDRSPLPPIGEQRFPLVRTVVFLSPSLREWLRERAREEAKREGGRASISAVLERVIRSQKIR